MIGIGNRMRGDDAAGPELARLVGELAPGVPVIEHEREPSGLLDAWRGASLAIVCDAVRAGGEPGTIHRYEVGRDEIPARLSPPASTHAVDLAEVIELGRELGRLPGRLVVIGIEAGGFETGAPLSAPVAAAVERLAAEVAAAARG